MGNTSLIQGITIFYYIFEYHILIYFEFSALPDAHEWNRKRADRELKAGTNPVVIDNTNLEPWEMQPYIYLALRYTTKISIINSSFKLFFNQQVFVLG